MYEGRSSLFRSDYKMAAPRLRLAQRGSRNKVNKMAASTQLSETSQIKFCVILKSQLGIANENCAN